MTEVLKDLRDFLFRGLMFEAETEKFRRAGIQVGADSQAAEAGLLDEVLSPFAVGLRNNALQMARLYALLYCFENSVRALIQERLEEKGGASWWISDSVPKKIREFAESRQKSAQENSWLEGQNKDPIDFIEFGHLADIVISNWEDVADLVPSQHWLKQRMEELEKVRNFHRTQSFFGCLASFSESICMSRIGITKWACSFYMRLAGPQSLFVGGSD